MYHVGRPGEDGYANRVLQAWGVDGHNSHTNVCSSSARLGHFLWMRRRSAVARLRQRADDPAALVAPRDRATTSTRTRSGSSKAQSQRRDADRDRSAAVEHVGEGRPLAAGVFRAPKARCCSRSRDVLLDEELYDREFVRDWVNWRGVPRRASSPSCRVTFESFIDALKERVRAVHAGVRGGGNRRRRPTQIVEAARRDRRARGTAFATHSWRAAAAGNLWGWQITRCLYLLVVLTGSGRHSRAA